MNPMSTTLKTQNRGWCLKLRAGLTQTGCELFKINPLGISINSGSCQKLDLIVTSFPRSFYNFVKQDLLTIFTMEAQFDYRNAKYQGEIDPVTEVRTGSGILIDDDLSFYASNWKDGKINGSSVIYMSHGKYIYGQWYNNEPHGLNVFRIADTVIVGEFQNGIPIKNVLIIFEKCNYVAILEQDLEGEDWKVIQGGALRNYDDLLRYIEVAQIPMKQQYFSLTKFLTSISNCKISVAPCRGSENCYFGFSEGLGIIFNPNNGVVSVGVHSNKKLTELGGKYELPTYVIEGNFETNEVIKYSKDRPKGQIYSIFQKMHKRSLNFKNQYFDSKVKLLTSVEELVRGKIDEIINKKHESNFTALDLNDSLDYHAENLQEANRLNKIREQVYQSVHIPMKKTTSKFVESSPIASKSRTSLLTPNKKNLIINAPASPIIMKKSTTKKDSGSSKNMTPSRVSKASNNKSRAIDSQQKETQYIQKVNEEEFPQSQEMATSIQVRKQKGTSRSPLKSKYNGEESCSPISSIVTPKSKARREPIKEMACFKEFQEQNAENQEAINAVKQEKRRSIYEDLGEDFCKRLETRVNRPIERSPIKGPTYEDLNDRRKRILKEFKNLNALESSHSGIIPPSNSTHQNRVNGAQKRFSRPGLVSDEMMELESPCAREKLLSYESKNTQQNSEMMPLSIRKHANLQSVSPFKHQGSYSYNYEISEAQQLKENKKCESRSFGKKESLKEDRDPISEAMMERTPTRKKTYKYYFD